MPANPNTSAPANTLVLILMPGVKRVWMRAVLGEQKGRRGLRWRIFDKANRSKVCAKEFQPLDWMPLLPEQSGVQ
jgi:hypothetical protein